MNTFFDRVRREAGNIKGTILSNIEKERNESLPVQSSSDKGYCEEMELINHKRYSDPEESFGK